ncbi:hypothetical protein P154DRAFT_517611 [Amniculicola lignicola CBS 123094]|uniref:Uncharacterized protein n=1 Tax=Amniculicola lignicola CBS 123094 TaxID=1392246 RepID=A0A6A5WZX7_9PLEO|nr:hypothetical protein P154DRAFT_517611 [Amniculicola lignicola CBS 123094]
MDVYTDVPSNAYKLHTLFNAVIDGTSVQAWSVSRSTYPRVIAAYSIIIFFLFVFLWKLLACLVLASFKADDAAQAVGLVGFWNCADPLSASVYSLAYIGRLLSSENSLHLRRTKYLAPAAIMVVISTGSLAGSLAAGIVYPERLRLADIAPVHPSTVFWPFIGQVGDTTTSEILSYSRPGIMRALGSAEFATLNTKLPMAHIHRVKLSSGNITHPQEGIHWDYKLGAEDFGLQVFPNFMMEIEGQCVTEYGWEGMSRGLNSYIPWGLDIRGNSVPVATEDFGSLLLDLAVFLHPDIDTDQQLVNRSFAFAATTSRLASFSASTDPWYYTETKNDSTYQNAPYRVKPHRPALSCWETTQICVNGVCYNTNLENSPIPEGLTFVFKSRFRHPMVHHIGQSAGASALKSYTGSAGGAFVDAGAASMYGDMERLVLAGYLHSRNVLRELIDSAKPAGAYNALEKESGILMEGADQFVVKTEQTVALRWGYLLAAPITTSILMLLVVILRVNALPTLVPRATAFQATQLFRQLSEAYTRQDWAIRYGSTPLPSNAVLTTPFSTILRNKIPRINHP